MLSDAVAVITGAGSGIGRATAESLADSGATVVVADVNVESGEETVSRLENRGARALFVETDVTDTDDVEGLFERTLDRFGRLDVAVNNAGIEGRQTPTAEMSAAGWQQVIDVNLSGVWRCLREELRIMESQESGGTIVNVGSVLGEVGIPDAGAYTAAKHGVHGLTKTTALEYAQADIRVNAVAPGWVDTPMLQRSRAGSDETVREELRASHALNRFVEPTEVAAAVRWLCSEDASFTTGTIHRVDGGYLSR